MLCLDKAEEYAPDDCTAHSSVKWWKKVVLCNLLEMSITNVKVIYKKLNPGKFDATAFRENIIKGLFGERLIGRHFISMNPLKTPFGGKASAECEVCSKKESDTVGAIHRTSSYCENCKVPLCVVPCFKRYHTMVNYKVPCTPGLHGN